MGQVERPRIQWVFGAFFAVILLGCGPQAASLGPESPPAPTTPVSGSDDEAALQTLGIQSELEEAEGYGWPGLALTEEHARPLADLWQTFVAALVGRDGPAAAALLSPDSVLFWQDVLTEALASGGSGPRSVAERTYAELARRRVSAEDLRGLDATGLFQRAVAEGWAAPMELCPDVYHSVREVALSARGAWVHVEQSRFASVRLDYWEGTWGVRFSSLSESFDHHATTEATMTGLSEDEYIAAVVDRVLAALHSPSG